MSAYLSCLNRISSAQTIQIVGWCESDKKNRPFASILLAQYENKELVYKGRCGTGFREQDTLSEKFPQLARNQRGSTSVLPFSARARKGAPVAAPVAWDELREIKTPACFLINDAETLARRAASADLKNWGTSTQVLPDL